MNQYKTSALLLIFCLGTGLANAATKSISLASFVNDSWCGQALLGWPASNRS
jgi:hypothetical protein